MLRLRENEASEVDLAPEDLQALLALASGESRRVLQSITPTAAGRYLVVPGFVVGRFRLPSGLVLDIRSRFDLARLSMLLSTYVGAPTLLSDDQVPMEEDTGLVDLLAVAFTDELESVVGRGLPKGYVERIFTRPPFAGRPDVATHLRRYAGRADRLITRAQRITQDIAVNQVLARAHELLLRAPLRHTRTRSRLHGLTPALAPITRPLDVDSAIRRARPRLPTRCRKVFDLAVLVLRGTGLLPQGIDQSGGGVLFPMPQVWEAFVEKVVSEESPPGHRVARQVPVAITEPPDRIVGRADVVEYDLEGRPVTVYDAKYKFLGQPATGDLFQVFTYCRRLRCHRAVLVLPGRGESSTVSMGEVTVEVRGLPVLADRPLELSVNEKRSTTASYPPEVS